MRKSKMGAYVPAIASGKMKLGDAEVAVHVLADKRRVIEITSVEALLGLPESGLGAFLSTLPGNGGRVQFYAADKKRTGLTADNVVDLLSAFLIANPRTAAARKAGDILTAMVRRGLKEAGQNPEAAEFLMAAAMPPRSAP